MRMGARWLTFRAHGVDRKSCLPRGWFQPLPRAGQGKTKVAGAASAEPDSLAGVHSEVGRGRVVRGVRRRNGWRMSRGRVSEPIDPTGLRSVAQRD